MALNSDEEKRFQVLESAVAEHTTAIKNLASKRQLSHILSLIERQLTEIRTDIASIKTQIAALKK
jgi:hypothetical protein